jgi:hypothetical protein
MYISGNRSLERFYPQRRRIVKRGKMMVIEAIKKPATEVAAGRRLW